VSWVGKLLCPLAIAMLRGCLQDGQCARGLCIYWRDHELCTAVQARAAMASWQLSSARRRVGSHGSHAELDCWCGVSLQFAPGLAQCLFDRMQLGGCRSESAHIAGAGEGAPPTISVGGSSGEAARSPGGSVSIAGAAQGKSTVEGLHRGPGGGFMLGHASGPRVLR